MPWAVRTVAAVAAVRVADARTAVEAARAAATAAHLASIVEARAPVGGVSSLGAGSLLAVAAEAVPETELLAAEGSAASAAAVAVQPVLPMVHLEGSQD